MANPPARAGPVLEVDWVNIHESAENYLEAILALGEQGPVRSIDVAQRLGFSKPSVSRAMSRRGWRSPSGSTSGTCC